MRQNCRSVWQVDSFFLFFFYCESLPITAFVPDFQLALNLTGAWMLQWFENATCWIRCRRKDLGFLGVSLVKKPVLPAWPFAFPRGRIRPASETQLSHELVLSDGEKQASKSCIHRKANCC